MEDKSHKLFDLDEYKSNIVTQFPGFEDKLLKTEKDFGKLETVFYNLLAISDKPEDNLNRFLMNIDKRIELFYDFFDSEVLNFTN